MLLYLGGNDNKIVQLYFHCWKLVSTRKRYTRTKASFSPSCIIFSKMKK